MLSQHNHVLTDIYVYLRIISSIHIMSGIILITFRIQLEVYFERYNCLNQYLNDGHWLSELLQSLLRKIFTKDNNFVYVEFGYKTVHGVHKMKNKV